VVPLFETLDDLEAAPSILGAFLEEPIDPPQVSNCIS